MSDEIQPPEEVETTVLGETMRKVRRHASGE